MRDDFPLGIHHEDIIRTADFERLVDQGLDGGLVPEQEDLDAGTGDAVGDGRPLAPMLLGQLPVEDPRRGGGQREGGAPEEQGQDDEDLGEQSRGPRLPNAFQSSRVAKRPPEATV